MTHRHEHLVFFSHQPQATRADLIGGILINEEVRERGSHLQAQQLIK